MLWLITDFLKTWSPKLDPIFQVLDALLQARCHLTLARNNCSTTTKLTNQHLKIANIYFTFSTWCPYFGILSTRLSQRLCWNLGTLCPYHSHTTNLVTISKEMRINRYYPFFKNPFRLLKDIPLFLKCSQLLCFIWGAEFSFFIVKGKEFSSGWGCQSFGTLSIV